MDKPRLGLSTELCRPTEEHAKQILQWRNNPETLAMFFHHAPKQWESFWKEFQTEYFSCTEAPSLFVVDENNLKVAFLRFKKIQHPMSLAQSCCDISINVAPEHRGKNIGTSSLVLALDYLQLRGIDDALAEIRKENRVSITAFEKAGFRLLDEIEKQIPDTGEQCQIVRYLANLSPSNKEK